MLLELMPIGVIHATADVRCRTLECAPRSVRALLMGWRVFIDEDVFGFQIGGGARASPKKVFQGVRRRVIGTRGDALRARASPSTNSVRSFVNCERNRNEQASKT
jgi:hypothetical protein